MPFVPVPGVAQSVLRGTVGVNPFALIWHWQFQNSTATWSQPNIQHLADQIFGQFRSQFETLLGAQIHVNVCETVDLGTSTPATGASINPGWTSAAAIAPPTLAACVMVNFRINARYRGGHPRTYLPGAPAGNTLDGDNWTASTVTAFSNGWIAMVNAIVSQMAGLGPGPLEHVVPKYTYTITQDPVKHKFIRQRTGLQGVFVVQQYTTLAPIRSQRRRLGR